MAERVSILNGNNINFDKDFSRAVQGALTEGVISGLSVTSTEVSVGYALVEVTRTATTPDETFYVVFENTTTKSITTGNNKYIVVEITQANINDGTDNEEDGTGIGEIKVVDTLPSGNYIELARTDGSGTVVTTNRQVIKGKNLRVGLGNHKLVYTDGSGNETELSFGTASQVLTSNGATSAPSWVNPSNLIGITGEIKIWTTGTAPTNWLICDGSAVLRTTYSDLFSVIGTTYGVGDGSTTFNLPNLKGKVVVGYDNTQIEFDAIGETGGSKTHILTVDEIPSHSHSYEIFPTQTQAVGGTGTAGLGRTTGQTGNTGGGLAHNNLQPYITLNYIIKT